MAELRRQVLDAARLAVGTLTAVPVPPPSSLERPVTGIGMLLAPVAGLVPGVAGAATAWLATRPLGLSSTLAAALAVAVAALLTRALHWDGLADTADGLAASYDRLRALEVMQRGDIGPTGVVAVLLVLLIQVLGLAGALSARGPLTVLVAVVAARLAVPVCCLRGVPAARAAGLGAQVAGSVSGLALLGSALAVAAAGAVLLAVAGQAWWPAVLAVALSVGTSWALVRGAGRRLGGITGDVIGAAVELATAAAAVALAVRP